jgi:hypothetical protein
MLFKPHGNTGSHGVSGFHHPTSLSPPRNPMECGGVLSTRPGTPPVHCLNADLFHYDPTTAYGFVAHIVPVSVRSLPPRVTGVTLLM